LSHYVHNVKTLIVMLSHLSCWFMLYVDVCRIMSSYGRLIFSVSGFLLSPIPTCRPVPAGEQRQSPFVPVSHHERTWNVEKMEIR
jgi:hypothetical protein